MQNTGCSRSMRCRARRCRSWSPRSSRCRRSKAIGCANSSSERLAQAIEPGRSQVVRVLCAIQCHAPVTTSRKACLMAISREADYVWGTGATEQQRLLQQIELYAPYASWLLDRIRIKNGSRAIDLGCGLLGIVDLLSERVGPNGEVLGVELEPRFVEIAEKLLAERGIKNARVAIGDATSTRMPSDSFHVVHERLLLIVVTEPE